MQKLISFPIQVALLLTLLLSAGCKDNYKVIKTNSTNDVVLSDFSTDDSLYATVEPYQKSLENKMNTVLNLAEVNLEIGLVQGLLGNFVADLVLFKGSQNSSQKIDISLLNNGGLRTPIVKGNITRGNLYELMPFENELVVLELSGEQVLKMVNFIKDKCLNGTSPKSGVPISGMKIEIKENEVTSIEISGNPFDLDKTYFVITSDYLSNGGDNMTFFENPIQTIPLGIKLRDIIIEYVEELALQNKKINAKIDDRIEITK